jgi:hypothetical protein
MLYSTFSLANDFSNDFSNDILNNFISKNLINIEKLIN